jgi:2-iminobutanoate/2-iminopropanoate deaminase
MMTGMPRLSPTDICRRAMALKPASWLIQNERAVNTRDDGISVRWRLFACAAIGLLSLGVATAHAQALEKKSYNYSEWAKGRFSEVVTVTGPGKMIFLAGVGAENEDGQPGDILHKGDVAAQCKYAFEKIKKALEKNGAGIGDIVKITTYLTDIRTSADVGKCRQEVFGSLPLPAHTLVNVSQLAWPGMLIEIDATAVAPLK